MLNDTEKKELRGLEQTIKRGQKAFLMSCQALVEIEKKRLFVAYDSMTRYCEERWGFSKVETCRYRKAGRVLLNLKDFDRLPENESQARALGVIKDEDEQRATWEKVLATGEKPSAKLIERIIAEVNAPIPLEESAEPAERSPAERALPAVSRPDDDVANKPTDWYDEEDQLKVLVDVVDRLKAVHDRLENEQPSPEQCSQMLQQVEHVGQLVDLMRSLLLTSSVQTV